MLDRLTNCTMLHNGNECGKKLCNQNLKATIPSTDYDRKKNTAECGIFQLFEKNNK